MAIFGPKLGAVFGAGPRVLLSRIVLVPLRHVPTGYVSYWLRFVQVGSSVAFGHGPADWCGH